MVPPDLTFESFLHCLDPELEEARITVEPPSFQCGTIDSIASFRGAIRITHTGDRGLFSCTAALLYAVGGIGFTTSSGTDTINLMPGQSIDITLTIDARMFAPNMGYANAVVLTKSIETFRSDSSPIINIPISFFLEYPFYSTRRAKYPIVLHGRSVYTLREVAESCYQAWGSNNDAELPSGLAEWIREGLGEKSLSERVEYISGARIHGNERCHRFLALTGVVDRTRLLTLLRRQVLHELDEDEKAQIDAIDKDTQRKIESQRDRCFNKPGDSSWPFPVFLLVATTVVGLAGTLLGWAIPDVSAVTGWILGATAGGVVAFSYRMVRAGGLTQHYRSLIAQDAENRKKAITSKSRDRKDHIDEDILLLDRQYSSPDIEELTRETDEQKATSSSFDKTFMYVASGVLFLVLILVGWSLIRDSLDERGQRTGESKPLRTDASNVILSRNAEEKRDDVSGNDEQSNNQNEDLAASSNEPESDTYSGSKPIILQGTFIFYRSSGLSGRVELLRLNTNKSLDVRITLDQRSDDAPRLSICGRSGGLKYWDTRVVSIRRGESLIVNLPFVGYTLDLSCDKWIIVEDYALAPFNLSENSWYKKIGQ